MTVKGDGISPLINLSVEDGCYDFGAVIAGEYREETFKVSVRTAATTSAPSSPASTAKKRSRSV